jgi:hypothetical protein
MSIEYYIDESGNTGDLSNVKKGLNFDDQPLFSLACVGGIEDQQHQADASTFLQGLRVKHSLPEDELKSQDIYHEYPEMYLDLVKYLSQKRLPIFVELVDKRFCIVTSIFSHQIFPYYRWGQPDQLSAVESERQQTVHDLLRDYLAHHLSHDCYLAFLAACRTASEETLMASLQTLKDHFCHLQADAEEASAILKGIKSTIQDYWDLKEKFGEKIAVKKFLPIPDRAKNGNSIQLLPHVHSIYNLFARLNKYHLGNLTDVALWHDQQDEFDSILKFCAEYISDPELRESPLKTQHADFDIRQPIILGFLKTHVGIEIADLVAGFCNRYVNGLAYKKIEINDIYHEIFLYFIKYNRIASPLGVNFVLPPSRRQVIFDRFMI